MGRNGMGKTTLLRSLMGLVADRRGRILLDGKDVTRAPPERSRAAASRSCRKGAASLRRSQWSRTWSWPLGRTPRRGPGPSTGLELFPRLRERRHNGGHQLSGGEQQMLPSVGR